MRTKNLLFVFSLLLIVFVFASCGDDDKDDEIDSNKIYKVRYEASCDNPDVTLRILYSTKNTDFQNVDKDAKEVFVKSPFSVELEMKKNEFCYISVQQQVDENAEVIDENIVYSSAIYVDGVKKKETINKTVAIAFFQLGVQ